MLSDKELTLSEYVKSANVHPVELIEIVLTDFLNDIYVKSGSKRPCPVIKIFLDDSQNASYLDGTIFLYSGLFKYLLEKSSENELSIKNHNVNYYFLCWVVAHEFSHFLQNHKLIKSNNPEISNSSFEFDADRLAITLFYESLKIRLLKNKKEIKKTILIALYFSFRNKVKSDGFNRSEKINTHPAWALRLLYSVTILSHLDCKSILDEESHDTNIYLMKVLSNLESDYKLIVDSRDDLFDFNNYAHNHAAKDFYDLLQEFEKLRILL